MQTLQPVIYLFYPDSGFAALVGSTHGQREITTEGSPAVVSSEDRLGFSQVRVTTRTFNVAPAPASQIHGRRRCPHQGAARAGVMLMPGHGGVRLSG